MEIMDLRVRHKFDAAHKLNDYEGKCSHLHGHTWHIEVYIRVEEVGKNGISIDFGEIKGFLREYLPDHKYLNEDLDLYYPTAENLAKLLYEGIKRRYKGLRKLVLWETEGSAVEYAKL